MIYIRLFVAFLQIGAFSFGGGYAAMPLIQAQVVQKYAWLSISDFSDLVTIAEMTPGPIAINAATFVGNQVAGIAGAAIATLGVILPSCIFVTILAWLYAKYRKMSILQGVLKALRPTVVAMIFTAGLSILLPTLFQSGTVSFLPGDIRIRPAFLFLCALVVLRVWKINPVFVMIGCGIVEVIAETVVHAVK